jgi:hypothetical protein
VKTTTTKKVLKNKALQKLLSQNNVTAKVIIAKQRNGPTGDVDLRFDGKYNLFRDADKGVVSPLPPPQAPPPMPGKPRNFAPGAST